MHLKQSKTVRNNLTLVVGLLFTCFAFLAFAQPIMTAYQLGSGDRLKIVVYGEPELSGEFDVDGSGVLSLPLVGEVQGGGLTVRALERVIENAYRGDYLLNPRVSAEVLNFRPFYILGEVKNPGNYPYISGMTALNAVAVAGGYTYRARKNQIQVTRTIGGREEELILSEGDKVMPGDVIHIDERFF